VNWTVRTGTYRAANAAQVAQAAKDNARQWQAWWWICSASPLVLIPFVFLMARHWNPRKGRAQEQEHELMNQPRAGAAQRHPRGTGNHSQAVVIPYGCVGRRQQTTGKAFQK
jgi:hypothetical protein